MTFERQSGEPSIFALKGAAMGGPDGLAFSSALTEAIGEGDRTFLVDLTAVDLMNSSGLGMLVAASRSIASAEGSLVLCGANDKLQELMAMTRLDSVFTLHATKDEALASLRRD